MDKARFHSDLAEGRSPFGVPGDIFFTRGLGGLAGAIRWAEQEKGESSSWANHTGLVTKAGWFVPPRDGRRHAMCHVSEALWKTEEHEWWATHQNNQGYAVAVFRPRFVNDNDVQAIVRDARTRTGDSYAWWRLPGFLITKLTGGRIKGEKLFFLERSNVCSTHMGLALNAGRVSFGKDPKELDPDYAMDYCIDHPEEFAYVGWTVVPGVKPTPYALVI